MAETEAHKNTGKEKRRKMIAKLQIATEWKKEINLFKQMMMV